METRKCWKCQAEKLLTNEFFSKDSTHKSGFQTACKTCQRERTKIYNKNNKEYFKQKGKEKYKKEDNPARYQRYKKSYLERRKTFSKSIRGKLYDLLEAARGRAKNKSLPIDIDLEYLIDLYQQQNGKCKLTNIEFTFNTRQNGQHFNPFNPSIDKIDSNKGYTQDNVRLVCVIVNLSLNEFGEENFKTMCQSYINNSKNKGEQL